MRVRCKTCENPALYNSLIGTYFCPDHGFKTHVVLQDKMFIDDDDDMDSSSGGE